MGTKTRKFNNGDGDYEDGINNAGFDFLDGLEYAEVKRGVVRLTSNIESFVAKELIQKMDFAVAHGAKSIDLYITSSGGGVYAAFAIHDHIANLVRKGINVNGYVQGFAASAASMIVLQACSRRSATENSRIHLHEPSKWAGFNSEKTSQMKDSVDEMNALSNMIFALLAKKCKKSKDEITRLVERRETWMSAKEAKKFGLIDSIV